MHKIGVVGSRGEVLCFMAAGFSVYEAENAERAAVMLRHAADDGCAVIFITDEYASELSELIEKYASAASPAVSILPRSGSNAGEKMLSKAVTRAVGSDIIFHGKHD